MTKKRKDLKVASPEWIAAWKKILTDGLAVRCLIEPSANQIRFWMQSFLIHEDDIYEIRFERFLGDTVQLPKAFARKYGATLQAFLDDLERFWTGDGRSLTVNNLALAVPHRGFIRPFGSTDVVLLPTNHPALMTNYGAVHEWAYQAKRGYVKSNNTLAEEELGGKTITYDPSQRMLWAVFERRFKTFLYQQELSVIRNTIGEIVRH